MGKLVRDETVNASNEILTEILHALGGQMQPKNAKQIQAKTRLGTIGAWMQPGDLIGVSKETGISVTVTGSVTAATVDENTFISKIGHSDMGAYEFTFDGSAWQLDGNAVEITAYGITITGTPAANDAVVVHVQASEIILETLGIDKDVPINAGLKHSISFLTQDVQHYGAFARCAPQALVAIRAAEFSDGIAANTRVYVHGVNCCYDGTSKQDGDYGFTPTKAIPVGGKIRHTTLGKYESTAANYTKAAILAGTFTTYDADGAVLEEGLETTEGTTGTLLGTVTASNPTYRTSENCNFTQRNMYGSNRAIHAAHKKWMESDAAGAASGAVASWWTPSDIFDMPIKSTMPGWLHGLDPEFRECLATVYKRTALSVADGYGYEDTEELVWAPSMTEMGFGTNNNVVETSPKGINGDPNFTGAYDLYSNAGDADRIKYISDVARYYFLRSPSPSYANSVRRVTTSGSLSYYDASNSYGAVAGVSIA